jgi:hypothetical protein
MQTFSLPPFPTLSPELLADLQQLEALQEAGDLAAADVRAEELLARFPDIATVVVEVARLRARQHRYDEALELLHRECVGKNVRLLNYRLCAPLRALAGATA